MLQQHHLASEQVVLLLRCILKGETTNELALRRELQKNAGCLLPDMPVPNLEAVSDELFQNAEKKGQKCVSAHRAPRRQANQRRGRSTYANDRTPVRGTIM